MSGHIQQTDLCRPPRASRKYAHRLWVCDCGQAWIARYESDAYKPRYGWEWQRWGNKR